MATLIAREGTLPIFDCYRRSFKDLAKDFEEILDENFKNPIRIRVGVERDAKDPAFLTVSILNPGEIDEEVEEEMLDAGLDPEDDEDVYNYLSFEYGGRQDTWLQYGGTDVSEAEFANVLVIPRKDVRKEIDIVMETVLEGTREEALAALNTLKKKVCVK